MTEKDGFPEYRDGEDEIAETPPPRKLAPETASMSPKELKVLRQKSEIDRKNIVTKSALTLLKVCVGFIIFAYAFEVVVSIFPLSRADSDAKSILNLIQYIAAGLMGYLFGQSSKE